MKIQNRILLSYLSVSIFCAVGLILVVLHFSPAKSISKVAHILKAKPIQNNRRFNQHSGKTNTLWSMSEEFTGRTPYPFDVDYFYTIDLVTNNKMVDKLSPLLNSHHEVIAEARRIHINMFKTLIGSYKYAMLFNLAANENEDDPAITVGVLKMIKKLDIELIFHCVNQCNAHNLKYAKELSNNYSSSDLVILIQGGGNVISKEIEDEHRMIVLERFMDFHAVFFPQSVWPRASLAHQVKFQEIYASHSRLTFLYRDRPSYELGQQLWPNAQSYLMPDMAFEIGAVSRLISPTHDIMWLRRIDQEHLTYKIPQSVQGYDVLVQDWDSWRTQKGASNLEDAAVRAANGMLFLQRGRVVIVDRLHGHILSFLCGIPHVIIDPVNPKVTSYMKSWTNAVENVFVANSSEDALYKAIGLLQKLDHKIPKALSFKNSIENLPK